jgi:hypothetical protein
VTFQAPIVRQTFFLEYLRSFINLHRSSCAQTLPIVSYRLLFASCFVCRRGRGKFSVVTAEQSLQQGANPAAVEKERHHAITFALQTAELFDLSHKGSHRFACRSLHPQIKSWQRIHLISKLFKRPGTLSHHLGSNYYVGCPLEEAGLGSSQPARWYAGQKRRWQASY